MKQLAANLFDRRFRDLTESSRARLPGLAPEWTDHNAHDPGIMLIELLAWVSEAQLYALSRRPRRDERAAYAALLGVLPRGTSPASGLIWPDHADPASPARTYAQSMVIPADAAVHVLGVDTSVYRPTHRVLWVPGRIVSLESRLADGRVVDLTGINERGGPPFQPFGEIAGPRDVLAFAFEPRGDSGFLPPDPRDAEGAFWTIGIRADAPFVADGVELAEALGRSAPLEATLVVGAEHFDLPIESDSTAGLLRTGALVLKLPDVRAVPGACTIELRAPAGFERPPRLQRIEPGVIPIVQGRPISQEFPEATGEAGWSFVLEKTGLQFDAGEEPLEIVVDEPIGPRRTWKRCDRLADQGPADPSYELDPASGLVTFGNGVNGRLPPRGSKVFVTYTVCDGAAGGAARNQRWKVPGFLGAFGINPDAVAGGSAPSTSVDQRREARRRFREDHALVTSADVVSAALALPLLEVARAWVVPAGANVPRTGVVKLAAMRARPSGKEPQTPPESRRWLAAIRDRLAPRMALGSRLVVVAPSYVDFVVRGVVEADRGRDTAALEGAIKSMLARRLALVDDGPDVTPRAPGVPVSRRDVAAWIRGVAGVRRVTKVELVHAGAAKAAEEIVVPRGGLPRFVESRIDVVRQGSGSER